MAFSLIQSGICKAVLVVGTEKQNSSGNKLNWDITRGIFDMPIHWAALYASNHFHKFNTKTEDLALISYKNHSNANKNPNAIFYDKKFSLSQILESDIVAEPLRKLDCCYPCDGASSILLVSEDFAYRFESPIWIRSISQNNQGASFASISHSLDYIMSTKIAAKEAFEMASMSPKDIDIAEVHDAFTILELLAYEDIGFVKKGRGRNFIRDKAINVNTRGGLLGCGHPIGATGICQTNEIVLQLQGLAKERQIGKLKTGLVHNMAAAGTSTTIILLQN
jgi:acetyl-CoA C-acetyltransferase